MPAAKRMVRMPIPTPTITTQILSESETAATTLSILKIKSIISTVNTVGQNDWVLMGWRSSSPSRPPPDIRTQQTHTQGCQPLIARDGMQPFTEPFQRFGPDHRLVIG